MAHLLISLMVVAVFFEFSAPFPHKRVKRHADGLFTSELSKIKNNVAMRSYLKSLLITKRSVPEMNFLDNFEDNETISEEFCFNWLYQNFLSERFRSRAKLNKIYKRCGRCRRASNGRKCEILISLSENDAEEAAQESYKLICQPFGRRLLSLKEYIPFVKSPARNL